MRAINIEAMLTPTPFSFAKVSGDDVKPGLEDGTAKMLPWPRYHAQWSKTSSDPPFLFGIRGRRISRSQKAPSIFTAPGNHLLSGSTHSIGETSSLTALTQETVYWAAARSVSTQYKLHARLFARCGGEIPSRPSRLRYQKCRRLLSR